MEKKTEQKPDAVQLTDKELAGASGGAGEEEKGEVRECPSNPNGLKHEFIRPTGGGAKGGGAPQCKWCGKSKFSF